MLRLFGKSTSLIATQTFSKNTLLKWQPPSKNYETNFGDYPKLPWISHDQRSPYQNWDDPVHRRNFGETIPEEFDLQDAYFPGEHDPVRNLIEGLKGQAYIFGIFVTFMTLAYFTYDPNMKPTKREIPESVYDHVRTFNRDKIVDRPYEVPGTPTGCEQIIAHNALASLVEGENHH